MSLEAGFRKWGEFVANHTLIAVAMYLLFAGICFVGWHKGSIVNVEQQEFTWLYALGPTFREYGIDRRYKKTRPWDSILGLDFAVGKNMGTDVVEHMYLDELHEHYKGFVNTSTRVWSEPDVPIREFDFTFRSNGFFPDTHFLSAGFPVFPHVHTSIHMCFRSWEEHLDTCGLLPENIKCYVAWNFLEPILYTVLALNANAAPFAQDRPNHRTVEPAPMKIILSKGCVFWTRGLMFSPWSWGGGATPGLTDILAGARIERLEAFAQFKNQHSPTHVKYRLALAQPRISVVAPKDVRFGRRSHGHQFGALVAAPNYMKQQYLSISSLAPRFTEDLQGATRKIHWDLFITGILLMIAFTELSFADFKERLRSHSATGSFAFNCVGTSTLVMYGLYMWTGIPLNGTQMLVIPLLALGLGVNDMFVLLIGLTSCGAARIIAEDYSEILGHVLAHAGEGVTLTTLCNIACFMNGIMIPVNGTQNMCLHASLVAMGNWAIVMTLFTGKLRDEIKRMKVGMIDIGLWSCVCFCQKGRAPNPEVDPWGTASQEFISQKFSPFVIQPPVWFSMQVLTLILLVLSFVSLPQMGTGWILYHFVPKGTNLFRGFVMLTENFSIWDGFRGGWLVDQPNRQMDVTDAFYNLIDPYPKMYRHFLPNLVCFFTLQMFLGDGGPALTACFDSSFDKIEGCKPLLWRTPWLEEIALLLKLPGWIFGLVRREEYTSRLTTWRKPPLDDPWAPILTPRTRLNNYNSADLVYAMQRSYDVHMHLSYSMDKYYIVDVPKNSMILDKIMFTRVHYSNHALTGSLTYQSKVMWYWEAFIYLKTGFHTALLSVSICIFGVTWGLLRSLKAAFVGTSMDVVIVIEVWGWIATYIMFNIFSFAFMLLAYGIAVEFTAHTIAYFELARGDSVQRLRIALRATLPAVLLGGISTVLSLTPLWFGEMMGGYVYCASILFILNLLGFFNGAIVLPCMLACLGFVLGLFGMGFQRVSSKRNSKDKSPQPAEPEASKAAENPAATGAEKAADATEYAVDMDDLPVSPVRKFEARGHFNQV